MQQNEQDDIKLEPLLIITLVLLIGAAFHQGVFQEVMAQAGAMAALCLLHVALMGWVEHLGRHIATLFRKRPTLEATNRAAGSGDPILDFTLTPGDIEYLRGATQAEPTKDSEASRRELSVWTSGQAIVGSAPFSKQLSRF